MPEVIAEFTGEYRFLSNFYAAPVQLDGVLYPTVEHAFQAAKTTDLKERLQIRTAPTPASAKRGGRRVTLRPDWEDMKVGIMYLLLRDKFERWTNLEQALLATGNAILMEGNTWGDTFWGVDVHTGKGQNQLGQLLMRVREELRT